MFRKFTFETYYINQIIYICSGAAPGFWFGGTSDKISYMNSFQVLCCNDVVKISVRGDIQQKCTHQRLLKNFEKFIKKLAQKFKKFSKIFQK